jgi:hypothetical protein
MKSLRYIQTSDKGIFHQEVSLCMIIGNFFPLPPQNDIIPRRQSNLFLILPIYCREHKTEYLFKKYSK